MEFVYVMMPCSMNGAEWEDLVIYLTKQEAIEASKKYSNIRIEIFGKKTDRSGYFPTYNYYKNGELVQNA
jgi:hypothetical protein